MGHARIAGGLDEAAGAVRNLFRPKAGADDVAETITGGKGLCPVPGHSFAPGTAVLMADGTRNPSKLSKPGTRLPQPIPRLARQRAKRSQRSTPTATPTSLSPTQQPAQAPPCTPPHTTLLGCHHHPMDRRAGPQPGDHLLDNHGRSAQNITNIKTWTGPQRMHDLTVADIHTYYVIAGDTPVLVHNCLGGRNEFGEECHCPNNPLRDGGATKDDDERAKAYRGVLDEVNEYGNAIQDGAITVDQREPDPNAT